MPWFFLKVSSLASVRAMMALSVRKWTSRIWQSPLPVEMLAAPLQRWLSHYGCGSNKNGIMRGRYVKENANSCFVITPGSIWVASNSIRQIHHSSVCIFLIKILLHQIIWKEVCISFNHCFCFHANLSWLLDFSLKLKIISSFPKLPHDIQSSN